MEPLKQALSLGLPQMSRRLRWEAESTGKSVSSAVHPLPHKQGLGQLQISGRARIWTPRASAEWIHAEGSMSHFRVRLPPLHHHPLSADLQTVRSRDTSPALSGSTRFGAVKLSMRLSSIN